MPHSPDDAQATLSRRTIALLGMLIAAGFGLTLFVFYPGVMTYDAKFVYEDIAKGVLGDWQSPAMTVLWSLIDPIAPGPGSMLLFIATGYWLAFGLLTFKVAQRTVPLAVALPLLALAPPAFMFIGIIWRDVLFATMWILAAALAFAALGRTPNLRIALQALALLLFAFGVLLRPNSLIAAPILGAYIVWPAQMSWKRLAIVYLPAVVGLFGMVQLIYYGALGATRQHPLHSIMVFDLGGITHFTKQNQFPVAWTEPETALLLNGCYRPTEWDLYWRYDPCQFVMHRLEGDKLFGTSGIVGAWAGAIAHHPVAYLQHRGAFMWNFLTGANLTMWTSDLDDPTKLPLAGRPAFAALVTIHNVLKPTPLFRAGTWLLLCIVVCGFAWRRRDTPSGAFAIGICGSSAVYVATFFAVGVASDFRYAYLTVLAGITGAIVTASGWART